MGTIVKEFKYDIKDNVDHILEEKGNTFVALRRIAWGNNEPKMDIRKWMTNANGDEMARGGTTLTKEGCDELVNSLIQENYGDTEEILYGIKDRDDFQSSLDNVLSGKTKSKKEESKEPEEDIEMYDPDEIFS